MNDRQVRAPDPSFDVGSVIGRSYKRHRAIESRRFLDKIDANVPSPPEVRIVLDRLQP